MLEVGDIAADRLLHGGEGVLELSYLVDTVALRQWLVIVALCDMLCLVGEELQGADGESYDDIAGEEDEEQSEEDDAADDVFRLAEVLVDVVSGTDDTDRPAGARHGLMDHHAVVTPQVFEGGVLMSRGDEFSLVIEEEVIGVGIGRIYCQQL